MCGGVSRLLVCLLTSDHYTASGLAYRVRVSAIIFGFGFVSMRSITKYQYSIFKLCFKLKICTMAPALPFLAVLRLFDCSDDMWGSGTLLSTIGGNLTSELLHLANAFFKYKKPYWFGSGTVVVPK